MWELYVILLPSFVHDMVANSHPVQSAVSEVIERMDEYYLSKEDWDTILELGVDDKRDQIVAKDMSTATKSALTRKWVVFLSPDSCCFT